MNQLLNFIIPKVTNSYSHSLHLFTRLKARYKKGHFNKDFNALFHTQRHLLVCFLTPLRTFRAHTHTVCTLSCMVIITFYMSFTFKTTGCCIAHIFATFFFFAALPPRAHFCQQRINWWHLKLHCSHAACWRQGSSMLSPTLLRHIKCCARWDGYHQHDKYLIWKKVYFSLSPQWLAPLLA